MQELLAPASVEFFSANSKLLGSKITLEQEIHDITQIPISALRKYNLQEFSVEERMEMLTEATAPYGNIIVESFHGLLVDFCRDRHIPVIVKGLRAVSDFDYELQMAQMNQQLSGVETLFMPTNPLWSFLSSSLVKEVAAYGGDVAHLVPDLVHRRLLARFAEQRSATNTD